MAHDELTDLTQDRALLRTLYAPRKGIFETVDVPALPFAILDGKAVPDQDSVGTAIKALYTAIYPIRREARARMGKVFVEPPVEGLYWAEDMGDLATGRRDRWKWRVQIALPVWADARRLDKSVAEMRSELGETPMPRWEAVHEGVCVQYLHVGQTNDLEPVIRSLYFDYLPKEGLEPVGAYHEIYLDDFQRVTPASRKTIIRQPIRKSA